MTLGSTEYRLAELERRLANVIRPGVITEVDYRSELVRVKYGEEARAVTAWVPWLTTRAGGDREWWAPEVDEQVVLLSPSGELANAVALTAIYSTDRPAPSDDPDKHLVRYSDGAEIEYDRANHLLRAVLPQGGAAEISAPDGVTVTGEVMVTGDLTIQGAVDASGNIEGGANITAVGNVEADGNVQDSSSTMQQMRTTYNTHTHGVAPGPVTPPTSPTHRMT